MKSQEALRLFHGEEKYNCAQAVLKAYQKEAGVSDCAVQAASWAGGGRAPGGTCGALYAARILLDDSDILNHLGNDFAAITGSTRCKEIWRKRHSSCRDCVALSTSLVERNMDILRSEDPDYISALRIREATLLPDGPGCGCLQQ